MAELLQYEFMRNAILAAILVSVACGIVGTLVVIRRIVFISGGIAHAAFGGIGLGYLVGVNPVLTAVPFSVAAALGIGILKKNTRVSEDAAIGVLWAVGMSLGIVFIARSPGYAPDLMSYLFGSILTVPMTDIALMLLLDVVIIALVLLFYKELVASSFDEEFALIAGVPTKTLYYVMLGLVALSVIVLVRVVGIILIIALLTFPTVIVRQFTRRLDRLMLFSTVTAIVLTVTGLLLSYLLDTPSGATIVLLLAAVFILSAGVRKLVLRGE